MLALRELQTRFACALFDSADERVHAEIVTHGVSAAERLEIYRNNLREGFIKALALAFPVVEKLVGVEYFRHLALDFFRAHPSRAGNLDCIGAPFPKFLRERFLATDYAYLPDVAVLELAWQHALTAPEGQAITADAFREIEPQYLDELQFDLHPASMLARSEYPIVRIWHANQADTPAEETIDLGSGGDNVLVLRAPECIEFHRLPASQFALLAALARGLTLGAALEAATALEPAFDLAAALRRFLSLNILVGLGLPARNPRGSSDELPAHAH